jgi:hypothetical protein
MFIGRHFGKRKPQWNFFINNYENFKYSSSSELIKLVVIGFIFQAILFAPIVYWIFQNYAIIENYLPQHLNLNENIQFEKKWIVFLILAMLSTQSIWNFFIWKTVNNQRSSRINHHEMTVLPDEAVDQRRAS